MLHRWYARRGIAVQGDLVDYVRAHGELNKGVRAMAAKITEEQKGIFRIALTHLEQSQRRSIAKYAQTGRQAMVDALEKERAKIAGCLACLDELSK